MSSATPARAEHHRWLAAEGSRLLDFAQASATDVGFGWLDGSGRVDRSVRPRLWVNARMTHVFALGHLLGRPGAAALADHGLAALDGVFRDHEHDGWFAETGGDRTDQGKHAYEHAFVVIAASSASVADRPGATPLLEEALGVVLRHFWSEREGACRESWGRDWKAAEDYRGANANMHMVEAFLAAADATGDDAWRRRALRIAELLVDDVARRHGWRIPEHFDGAWNVLLDYNRDDPRHPFRPCGVTPGHGLEWARLLLQLAAALGGDSPPWIHEAARTLFARAVTDGWDAERGGFVYTTDYEGRTLVPERFHWVVAEAIGAAAVLSKTFEDDAYDGWYDEFWTFAEANLLDRERGSWHHELDAHNRPGARTWRGKPDVYHALQATLVARLPATPGLALALSRGHLTRDLP